MTQEHNKNDVRLPLYKCHRRVKAAKILDIAKDYEYTVLHLVGGELVKVDSDWLTRNPKVSAGGYFVEYQEGDKYTSYSPAAPFEAGYTLISGECFEFGVALSLLKEGCAVRRAFWPERMFISLSPGADDLPASAFWNQHNADHARANDGTAKVHPCITCAESDGTITMGWVPNCYDIFGDDWQIAE